MFPSFQIDPESPTASEPSLLQAPALLGAGSSLPEDSGQANKFIEKEEAKVGKGKLLNQGKEI